MFEMSNQILAPVIRRRSKAGSQPVAEDQTRAKLLASAGEVFARMGYHSATIREICTRAGANVAAINYHFGGKLGLYTEVFRLSIGGPKSQAVLRMFDQGGPPGEVFRRVIKAMMHRMCGVDRHELNLRFRLMAHELVHPTPARSRVIDEAIRPIYLKLLDLIGSILKLPSNDEKTRLCTHSVVGQIAHYAHARPILARLWPEQKMTPEQMEQIADHIADFSLAYFESFSQRHSKTGQRHPRRRTSGGYLD